MQQKEFFLDAVYNYINGIFCNKSQLTFFDMWDIYILRHELILVSSDLPN